MPQPSKTQRRTTPSYFVLGIILLVFSGFCFGQDIALVSRQTIPDVEKQLILKSADFYGMPVHTINLESASGAAELQRSMKSPTLRAVLISYDALASLHARELLRSLQAGRKQNIPVLIFGVSSQQEVDLSNWSNGTVQGCLALPPDYSPVTIEVGKFDALTGTLSGSTLEAVTTPLCALKASTPVPQNILIAQQDSKVDAPLLIRTFVQGTEVFFAPKLKIVDLSWVTEPLGTSRAFSYFAPFLMFMRYAAGEYGWHMDHAYANLTIDDPWLVEPYGHLNYGLLLAEMERHNFHTTIAFIPWNYDRSRSEVASLFRTHPDRYSICIHGDDHSHNEFAGSEGGTVEEQSAKLRQAIARMDKFHTLTGISYDRFMVFPHSVASEPTFVELKKYGFLGTANSVQVPTGSPFPSEPSFLLRPFTTKYGDLLSMFRYSAEVRVPTQDIAVQVFLGNPVLFYGHQQLFDKGIAAFDDIADFVNGIQPHTRWVSLGEIARHSYLIRKSNDATYDVQMLTDEITLEGQATKGQSEFHIARSADPARRVKSVEIDGKPVDFTLDHQTLRMRAVVAEGQRGEVRIHYLDDPVVANENLDNSGIRVWGLRKVSDFRDMTLSRSSWGRRISSAYYRNGWNLIEERWEGRFALLALVVVLGFGGFIVFRTRSSSIHKRSFGG